MNSRISTLLQSPNSSGHGNCNRLGVWVDSGVFGSLPRQPLWLAWICSITGEASSRLQLISLLSVQLLHLREASHHECKRVPQAGEGNGGLRG